MNMDKLKKLIQKYNNILSYAVFGVLTTIVNVACYYFLYNSIALPNVLSTVSAWIVSVTFAYVTNRKFVFLSKASDKNSILKEFAMFILCRLATGVLDVAVMYISVDILKLNAMLMKVLSNILVIIINYIASKFIIFKNK